MFIKLNIVKIFFAIFLKFQGIDPELKPIESGDEFGDDRTVVHGTFGKFWSSIKEGGLSRMKRNHIHFARGNFRFNRRYQRDL